MIRCGITVAVLCLMMTPWPAAAKEKKTAKSDYAVIIGTVYGADDRPAPGVKLHIRRVDAGKPKWESTSDSRGEFAQRLPAGKADYLITPELKDKAAGQKSAVKVHIEKNERQDVAVHLIPQELTKK